jgi:hypothetical protein
MAVSTYSLKDLAAEVSRVIEDAIREERSMPATEIVRVILARHVPDPARVGDFVALACYWMVREQVHKILATMRRKNLPHQAELPGFARLLPAYIVVREEVETIVVLPQMSDEELEAKAREYEAMAEGCLEHAGELRRYARERRGEAPPELKFPDWSKAFPGVAPRSLFQQ